MKLPDPDLQLRLQLEQKTSRIAREVLVPALPQGVGFCLVLYDFGAGGSMAYCANGQRDDVIKMLEELTEKMRRSEG